MGEPAEAADERGAVSDPVATARREVAAAQARLAAASICYADGRILDAKRDDRSGSAGPGRPKPGEFVADELSVVLRQQPWHVRCLLARSRRLRADLPTVWAAYSAGEVDAEQVIVIDRIARRVSEPATLTVVDETVVDAAATRTPRQLASWLLRLVVRLEPEAFAARHGRALAERGVRVVQGPDGIGYVTGEVSAADAAAIDGLLEAAARSVGAEDPRTVQQRRSDLFADLLLGRLRFSDDDPDEPDDAEAEDDAAADEAEAAADQAEADDDAASDEAGDLGWLEVEDIDPDTGELLGTQWRRVDADGVESGQVSDAPPAVPPAFKRRPSTTRIGVVVPLSSLLGFTNTPGELADRSGCVPAETLRDTISGLLDGGDQVLFTRLLTDDGGRLLDTTELGRYPSRHLAEAIRLRAGTCRYPTCTVPADRCDADHHDPVPRGPTSATNVDPGCRRHHRGKTFAWLASVRDGDTVTWTLPDAHRYRCVDDPLPTGIGEAAA